MRVLFAALGFCILSTSTAACSRDKDAPPATSTSTTGAPVAAATTSPTPAAKTASFSCDRRQVEDEYSADTCIDFSKDAVDQGMDYVKRPCHNPKAVFSETACPKENVVATCESKFGKNLFRYYAGGKMKFTLESATKQCTEMYGGKIL